jgi:protein SCO1/2
VNIASVHAEALSPASILMVDQRGAIFSLNSLEAPYLAVTFVAARCLDTCPISNAMFAKVQKQVLHDRLPIALVTVTLDPEHDTPSVMRRLAQTFQSNEKVWRFASGEPNHVESLMRAFGITVQRDKDGVPEGHDTFIYILDSQRKLAKTLVLSDSLPADIISAVSAAEKSPHASSPSH